MKKIISILGISLLGFIVVNAILSLTSSEIRNYTDKGYILSDNFITYSECNTTKDKYNLEYPSYKRSECFSDGQGYKYFICQLSDSCSISSTNNVATASSLSTSKTTTVPNQDKLDKILGVLENKPDYLDQFQKILSVAEKKYENEPNIMLMINYLQDGVNQIIGNEEEDNFLCMLTGGCNISTNAIGTIQTNATTTYSGCMSPDITLSNGQTWAACDVNNGATFTWNDAKLVCGTGYHLPSIEEWKNLGTNNTFNIGLISGVNNDGSTLWSETYWLNDSFDNINAYWGGYTENNSIYYDNWNYTWKVFKMRVRCIKNGITTNLITQQSTVIFNTNGGGTSSFSTKTVTGNTVIGTLPTISRTGYTFDGWFTQATGGTQITTSTIITGNVTYYAHWTAIINTTYPGCTSADIILSNGQTWASCDVVGGFIYTQAINQCINGYHLPNIDEIDKLKVNNPELLNFQVGTHYHINYYVNPNYKSFYFLNNTISIIQNSISNSLKKVRCIKDTGTISTTQSTVTFNANGGGTPSFATKTVTGSTTIGTLPTISRTGYTFDGWFTQVTGGTQITTSTIITGNVTYYAHWTAIITNNPTNPGWSSGSGKWKKYIGSPETSPPPPVCNTQVYEGGSCEIGSACLASNNTSYFICSNIINNSITYNYSKTTLTSLSDSLTFTVSGLDYDNAQGCLTVITHPNSSAISPSNACTDPSQFTYFKNNPNWSFNSSTKIWSQTWSYNTVPSMFTSGVSVQTHFRNTITGEKVDGKIVTVSGLEGPVSNNGHRIKEGFLEVSPPPPICNSSVSVGKSCTIGSICSVSTGSYRCVQ